MRVNYIAELVVELFVTLICSGFLLIKKNDSELRRGNNAQPQP